MNILPNDYFTFKKMLNTKTMISTYFYEMLFNLHGVYLMVYISNSESPSIVINQTAVKWKISYVRVTATLRP